MAWHGKGAVLTKAEEMILKSMLDGGAKPVNDTARLRDADRAIAYYENIGGYQESDLAEKMAGQFKEAETWAKISKTTYNLVRPICNTLAKVYSRPVIRTWLDENDAALFAGISGYNRLMKHIDLYTDLGGMTAVRPEWDEATKTIKFTVFYGGQIELYGSATDPADLQVLHLHWKYGNATIEQVWTATTFVEIVDNQVTREEENVYGMLPFVIFRNQYKQQELADYPATDLVTGNLKLNWLMTVVNDVLPIQISGLLVTKGKPDDLAVKVGHRARLNLPADPDADAKFINANADIDKGISVVNLNLEMFFSQRNIPESAIRATQLSGRSGIALLADQAALVDYWNDRQVVLGPLDARLAAMAVAMLKRQSVGNTALELGADPSVRYKQLKTPMSADERAQWDWELANGVKTPVDYVLSDEPGLSREDALKRLQDLQTEKAQLTTLAMPTEDLNPDEGAGV